MFKKVTRVLVVLLLLFINIVAVKAEGETIVPPGGVGYTFAETFPDAMMAQAVASKLKKTPEDIISQSDVDNSINWTTGFTSKGITDITGISHFKNLYDISFVDNQLSELPDEIQTMKYVWMIQIDRNNFTEIPEIVTKVQNLMYLGMSENQLTEIPEFIWGMTKFTHLYLNNNHLTELSADVKNLVNLMNLDLAQNNLTSLPTALEELEKIVYFNAKNQVINLPIQDWSDVVQVTNLITYNDEAISPLTINHQGIYSAVENQITWTNLLEQDQVLSYMFNKTIQLAQYDYVFSGTVNLPVAEKYLIQESKISPLEDLVYHGLAHEPLLKIEYNGNLLKLGTDYEVVYEENINVGMAVAMIKGIGLFKGEASVNFEITKATPTIVDLPIASKLSAGDDLEDSQLSGGKVMGVEVDNFLEGSFTWLESEVINENGTYKVRFTPESENYIFVDMAVEVSVIQEEKTPIEVEESIEPEESTDVEEPTDLKQPVEEDGSKKVIDSVDEVRILPNTGIIPTKFMTGIGLVFGGSVFMWLSKKKNK